MSQPPHDDEPDDALEADSADLAEEVEEKLEVAKCSFCGRTAFEVERLVAQGGARICNICIKEFHARLNPKPKPES